MPRPAGWKPLSYATLAQICGKIALGHTRANIATEFKVEPATVAMLKRNLRVAGLDVQSHARDLPPEVTQEIARLVKAAELTNHQIRVAVGLTSSCAVRSVRRSHYRNLLRRGEAIPTCACGKPFQDGHRCSLWGKWRHPTLREDELDANAVLKDLKAGLSKTAICSRYGISVDLATRMERRMHASQKRTRRSNLIHPRQMKAQRERAAADPHAIFKRLAAVARTIADLDVRDDVLQMMAEAVISGALTETQAIERKRQFLSQAYEANRTAWQTASFDDAEEGLSLAERLPDESALAAFDHLSF